MHLNEFIDLDQFHMLFEMRRRETRLVDVARNNHLNFLENDPTDIEVQETEFAGKRLFARRKFTKGEFIVNYRGVTKETSNSDNIYVFDIGKPDHTVIDASNYPGACGRYINDIDPTHSKNCFPENFFSETKQIGIQFTINRTVDEGEEFWYDYGQRMLLGGNFTILCLL